MFMVDIETVGIDPRAKEARILQVAMLECNLKKEIGYWTPGKEFNVYQKYTGPQSKWAKKNQDELYKTCNNVDYLSPDTMRRKLIEYFKELNAKMPVRLMGVNAGVFDCTWLDTFQYLYKAQKNIKTQALEGDFHYQIFEIGSAVALLPMVLNKSFKYQELLVWGERATGLKLPEGKSHDGLYDCYRQLATLNGIIYILRGQANV